MSKFKVGDRVKCINKGFSKNAVVGKTFIVTGIRQQGGFTTKETEIGGWFRDDNFELAEWRPQPGEMIEVRQRGDVAWKTREFFTFDLQYPICYIYGRTSSAKGNYYHWDEYRQIKPEHTITIDGKDITISDDSFKALKEQLCD